MDNKKPRLTKESPQDMPPGMDTKTLEAMDPTRNKKDIVRLFARVPEPLRKELIKRAKAERTSLNSYLTHIIVEHLKKH